MDINLRLEVVNMINTDGTEMYPCFGVNGQGGCYDNPTVGTTYDGGASLAPGASTGASDIDFLHVDNGNGPYPKDYVFKISALNANHGDAFLSSVTFTYRYDPTQNIHTLTKKEFDIFTIAENTLQINTQNVVDINIYSLTGQIIKSYNLSKGKHILKTDIPAGIYVIYANSRQKEVFKKLIIK